MNMTTERSTYTYETGERETVTLRRGPVTPTGHALLRIDHHDGSDLDCYVNTVWLRDRLNDLDPRPLTPDAITDEMVERAIRAFSSNPFEYATEEDMRAILTAALTEPPARPEGAEDMDEHLRQANAAALGGALTPEQRRTLADHLAGFGYRNPIGLAEEDPR